MTWSNLCECADILDANEGPTFMNNAFGFDRNSILSYKNLLVPLVIVKFSNYLEQPAQIVWFCISATHQVHEVPVCRLRRICLMIKTQSQCQKC